MTMELKEVVISVASPATPSPHPATPPSHQSSHATTWQTQMDAAFAAFLKAVNVELLQVGQLKTRPIVLSYADLPQEENLCIPEVATRLASYLSAAGLHVILNPLDINTPQAGIEALQTQLDQHPETQVILLTTPAYKELANQQNKLLHQILLEFGSGKKDSLLPLMCLGGFGVAAGILPNNFIFRDYKASLRTFDGPQGGMPAFLDLLGDLSGKGGLGLLPDLLDLESTNAHHKSTYAALFTQLSQTQARLTTDHGLEENLDAQLATNLLRQHYEPAHELQIEGEEKHNDVPEKLSDFLADPRAKTTLLIVARAEQDQRIYEVPQRRSLYIEARGKAEQKGESAEFGLTARFDAFLSTRQSAEELKVESKQETLDPSQATTFVALGEGGSGKSLFSQIQYARLLEAWQKHKADPQNTPRPAWIPVYIPLKQYVGKYEDTPENRAANRVGEARVNTCVETALRETYHLDDVDIATLKTGSGQTPKLGVVLILDGYDELGGETPHLYRVNHLDQWTCPLKLLITSRIDYIPDSEKHKQYFETQACSFVCSYIQPFAAEDIQRYIQLYEAQELIKKSQAQMARDVASGFLQRFPKISETGSRDSEQPGDNASLEEKRDNDTYQTLATLPGLLELVKNPFLLNLVLQGLPYLLAERKAEDNYPVTRLAIYNSFSQYWFGKEVYRLEKQDNPELRLRLEQHAERLAFQLHLYRQLSVSQKRAEDKVLWDEFFDSSVPAILKARAALPLRDVGDQQYEFMHKTLFEYFVTRHLVNAYYRAIPNQPHPNPIALGEALAARSPEHKLQRAAGVPLPVQDAGVFNFLKDVIETQSGEGSFQAALFEQITRSARAPSPLQREGASPEEPAPENDFKQGIDEGGNAAIQPPEPPTGGPLGLAAAHAVTILAKTGTSLANQTWQGIQLPGADLGFACLPFTDLSRANLRGAHLANAFLYNANLQHANLAGVRFREYPDVKLGGNTDCFSLYPSKGTKENKPWLVAKQGKRAIIINYMTREIVWGSNHCAALHPTGDQVVSASHDKTLGLWQVEKESNNKLNKQAVLCGHENAITCVAFHPAGNQVVSGSYDKTLLLWEVGENSHGKLKAQAVLQGHTDYVAVCAFNPAGDQVVSGSGDATLRLWRVGKNSCGQLEAQAVLQGHTHSVTACAFNPTGDLIVSMAGSGSEATGETNDQTLRLWQVGEKSSGVLSAQIVLKLSNKVKRFCFADSCVFSPAGNFVVSTIHRGGENESKILQLWQVDGRNARGEVNMQAVNYREDDQGEVGAYAFNASGDQVVLARDDHLALWQVDRSSHNMLSVQAVLRGHNGKVTSCAFNATNNLVVSASDDMTLRIWQVGKASRGELSAHIVLRGHDRVVTTCAFNFSGTQVISRSWDSKLRFWQIDSSSQDELNVEPRFRGHHSFVTTCTFNPTGDQLVSGSEDKTLRLWQVREKSLEKFSPQMVQEYGYVVSACTFNPTSNLIASGGGDRKGNTGEEVRLWQLDRNSPPKLSLQASYTAAGLGRINACAFSPAGDQIVVAGMRNLWLWQVGKQSLQATLEGHDSWVNACAFNPQGGQVVSGSNDRTLRLWSVEKGSSGKLSAQAVLEGHKGIVNACAFNSVGNQVISGSYDKTLRLWPVSKESSGELSTQIVLQGHESSVSACAFNSTDDQVISGSDDKTFRLWDVRDIHHVVCVCVVRWYSNVRSITLHCKSNTPPRMVIGDMGGLLSMWEIDGGQFRFIGMPTQPAGFASVWRDTWLTVKLANTQVTESVKNLLEQYRGGKPLQEGSNEDQVRLVAEIIDETPHEIAQESKQADPIATQASYGMTAAADGPQNEMTPAPNRKTSTPPQAPRGTVGFLPDNNARKPSSNATSEHVAEADAANDGVVPADSAGAKKQCILS